MTDLQSEVFEALRSINIPEEKALAAAGALSRRDPALPAMAADIATLKTDVAGLKTDMAGVQSDVATLKTDVAALKVDMAAVKVELAVLRWMTGFVLAAVVTILLKLFLH